MENDRLARNWPSAVLMIAAIVTATVGISWPHFYAIAGFLMLTALLTVLIDISEYLHDIAHRDDDTE